MKNTYTIWFKSGDRKVITAECFNLIYQSINNKPSKKICIVNTDMKPIMLIDIDEIFFIEPND